FATTAFAHKPSDSYLSIELAAAGARGQWDIALRDLEFAIGLDADGDGRITWGELKAKRGDIEGYAFSRLKIHAGKTACVARPENFLVDEHSDGTYAVLRFAVDCGAQVPASVGVAYSLFFDLDPTHRGLVRFAQGARAQTWVLSPERPSIELKAGDASA